MRRWSAQLVGSRCDLEEFSRHFPDGDVYAIEKDGQFFLVGSKFEQVSDFSEVEMEAKRSLCTFSSIVSLLWPGFTCPTLGTIWETNERGGRMARANPKARSRSKASAVGSTGNGSSPSQTQAQRWLETASGDFNLTAALEIFASSRHSWTLLYVVLEQVESFLGGMKVHKAGFCRRNERQLFARTANSGGHRHAKGKFDPPANPMTLTEAEQLIRSILTQALQRANPSSKVGERRTL